MTEKSTTEKLPEGFVPESGLPLKVSLPSWKLGRKAKHEPKARQGQNDRACIVCECHAINLPRMPGDESLSESRMREIRTSGSTRGREKWRNGGRLSQHGRGNPETGLIRGPICPFLLLYSTGFM